MKAKFINKLKKKSDVICWATDFSNFRGEGVLARSFIKNYSKEKKIKVFVRSYRSFFFINNGKIEIEKKFDLLNLNIFHKYLLPFIGLIYLWINIKKKIMFINYVPLWNFLIFLFSPKKIKFGPITGGSISNERNFILNFIRKNVFYFFYKISVTLIRIKKYNVIFSTDLLLKYTKNLPNKKYSYAISIYQKRKKIKKTIDCLVYYRKHSNKNNSNLKLFINNMIKNKKKIYVVGDKLNFKGLKNLGNIERQKLFKYLDKTKYSFSSSENYYALFIIDSIASNVKIIVNKNFKNKLSKYFHLKNFIFYKDISKIKKYYFKKKNSNTEKKLLLFIKKMNKYLVTI